MTPDINRRSCLKTLGAGSLSFFISPGAFARSMAEITEGLAVSEQSWAGFKQAIVIDGLSLPFDAATTSIDASKLAQMAKSGLTAANATIPSPGDDFKATDQKVDNTLAIIQKYPEHFRLVTQVDDILEAKKQGKIGIIIGFQSTEMFGDDLSKIAYFANKGARIMQLTYNGPSQFGAGGLVHDNPGLSPLGIQALKTMEEEKVLVDLSHAGQKTVADAIAQASRPLTISHTGCNAIYQHPRNNDDAELRTVAEQGGNVGIYLMPFLEGGDGEITAEMFMQHMMHAIHICGTEHVSIGSDQRVIPVNDTPEYREMIRQEVKRRIAAGISAPGETPNRPPFIPQLNRINRMEQIAWHLHKKGYSDDVVEKILGLNLLRLYQQVW